MAELIGKSKTIEILKTEKACVERNIKNQCNRECAKCDLLREDAEILQAYDSAIKALVTESEIRAKAIDDFHKALEELTKKNWIDHLEYGITWAEIDFVTEQLK